jgi:hypothetical protein
VQLVVRKISTKNYTRKAQGAQRSRTFKPGQPITIGEANLKLETPPFDRLRVTAPKTLNLEPDSYRD